MDQVGNNIPIVTLEKKVEFLSSPEAYTEHPEEVIAKETHMSWVFLAGTHAYKLKKPVQYSFLDFSTLEARHKDCKEEVRLNRRLAEEVYLGVVPLTLDGWGHLYLNGEGEVIDWLVRMRRLPEVFMLDYLMQYHLIPEDTLQQSAELLAAFYKTQPPADINPAAYCTYLEEKLHDHFHELTRFDLPYPLHHEILARQQQFLSDHNRLFEERVHWGRVLEAHGDLRPEHICLQSPPVIIDCLEFNPALRTVDVADELSFFTLECEVRESPKVAEVFWKAHREVNEDTVPQPLIDFYKSYRAVLRALLAMRHTLETDYRHDHRYQQQTQQYLQRAEKYVQNL